MQGRTGWSDNTILTEIICDNHEVFVNEKRQRMEGQEGPTKIYETRSTKKKENVEASRA